MVSIETPCPHANIDVKDSVKAHSVEVERESKGKVCDPSAMHTKMTTDACAAHHIKGEDWTKSTEKHKSCSEMEKDTLASDKTLNHHSSGTVNSNWADLKN